MSRAAKRAAEKRRLRQLYEAGTERRERHGKVHMTNVRHAKRDLAQAHADRQLQRNGFRHPHKSRHIWAEHDCDQGFWKGSRLATRGNVPIMPQYGIANELEPLTTLAFLEGVALYVQSEAGDWRVEFMGETLGYAPPKLAMAWKIAAERKGVLVEVYSEA